MEVSFQNGLKNSLNTRLRRIYGIGKTKKTRFFMLYKLLDIRRNRRTMLATISGGRRRQLTIYGKKKMGQLSDILQNKHKTAVANQYKAMAYKALRKTLGLPCNGQRTKSNSRTSRLLSGVYERKRYTLVTRRSSIRLRTEAIIKERKKRARIIAGSIKKLQKVSFGAKRKAKDRKKGMKEKLKRR